MLHENSDKQDCIPVGCVPPTYCPYLPAYTVQRGVSALRGMSDWGVSAPGGCVLLGVVCSWGVSAPRGVSALGEAVCSWGIGIPACTEADPP